MYNCSLSEDTHKHKKHRKERYTGGELFDATYAKQQPDATTTPTATLTEIVSGCAMSQTRQNDAQSRNSAPTAAVTLVAAAKVQCDAKGVSDQSAATVAGMTSCF